MDKLTNQWKVNQAHQGEENLKSSQWPVRGETFLHLKVISVISVLIHLSHCDKILLLTLTLPHRTGIEEDCSWISGKKLNLHILISCCHKLIQYVHKKANKHQNLTNESKWKTNHYYNSTINTCFFSLFVCFFFTSYDVCLI